MRDEIGAFVCWRCGAALGEVLRPLPRAEICRSCNADLHVCKACRFYDTGVAKHCREPIAEEVKDKERANFCDYLELRGGAWRPADRKARSASLAGLGALFGEAPGAPAPDSPQDQAEQARRRLDDLFGDGGR